MYMDRFFEGLMAMQCQTEKHQSENWLICLDSWLDWCLCQAFSLRLTGLDLGSVVVAAPPGGSARWGCLWMAFVAELFSYLWHSWRLVG